MRPLLVKIHRDAFIPFFTFKLEDGQTLDLDPDDARKWCRDHGADQDVVEDVLDYVWNFRDADMVISNPKDCKIAGTKIDPLI